MSLLIKALKKAEKRHQEATASAIAQVSEDPTMKAAAQAASEQSKPSMQQALTEPVAKAVSAIPNELAGPDAWRIDSPAPSTESPVITAGSFAAMSLSLEPGGLPDASPPTPSIPAFEPTPVATSVQDKSPEQTAAPAMAATAPAAPPVATVKAEKVTSVPAPAANLNQAKPVVAAPQSKKPGGAQLTGMALPGWMASRGFRIGAVCSIAVSSAGGWLAWQAYGPSIVQNQQQVQTPPGGLAPLGELSPPKPEDKGANPSDKSKSSSKTGRSESAALNSGPRNSLRSDTGPAIRGGKPKESSAAGTEVQVGASLAMLSPGPALASPKLSAPAGSALEPRIVASTPPKPAALPSQAAAPTANASSGPRFLRQDNTEQVARLLDQGFAAMGKQDRRNARRFYEQALDLDRLNVDAMVGLASISALDGDVNSAERIYAKVLELDPNDSAARAGLSSLRVAADPAGQESQLRHILASDPSQPAVQFALGNSLAVQGRWTDAQQAYFQAFSGDAANPDYAFNLAIALERVRQPGLAANYYRKAIELAQKRPARFNLEQAQTRVKALERSAPPQAAVTLISGDHSPKD